MNAELAAFGPEERDDLWDDALEFGVANPILDAHDGIVYSGPPTNPNWDPFALDNAPLQQFRDRISSVPATIFPI